MDSMPRRDFMKLALAGAGVITLEGCRLLEGPRREVWQPGYSPNPALREFRAALRCSLEEPVRRGEIPGAVGLVQAHGMTVFHEAFGSACLTPGRPVKMHKEHRFDLASLTKVVATTSSIMMLRDQGRLELDDPLGAHLPGLAGSDKAGLTIRQCITHTAGLPPFRLYYKKLHGRQEYLKAIAAEPLIYRPGTKWDYSDLGFILLGMVVEAAAGEPLDVFTREKIFKPLGMTQTGYLPIPLRSGEHEPVRKLAREFAATERCPWRKRVMAGEVHDENAWALGGVSGHAGLFSTAADLGRFGQMLLSKGEWWFGNPNVADHVDARILSGESVALLDRPQVPAVCWNQCVGWRWRTSLESTIGFLGSPRAFGHTGFTGTSMWLDPDNQVVAVLLTNAVHPDRAKAHSAPVRKGFHQAIVTGLKQAPEPRVKTGLDVLEAEGFARLKGKRVAVVTNQTAVNGEGKHLLDLLAKQKDVRVTAIFSPEHGFMGEAPAGAKVGDSARGAIPVYSLYGERRAPSREMAETFDVVVYDIQDVGVRFYTYIWTMFSMQQFCAEHGKRFIVLDRPDPLGGKIIEGPLLEAGLASGVGRKPLPIRYGLTCGELATLYNQQGWLGNGERGEALSAELDVVQMEGWRRGMRFHQTGLPWVAPSPNMPTWDTVAVYPGTCLFEGTGWSEGRGTATPFEMVGGPGVDAKRLAEALNGQVLPGCRFLPAEFTPRAVPACPEPKHKNIKCGGVFIRVDDHEAFRPVQAGLAVLLALRAQAPERHAWKAAHFDRLVGTGEVRNGIEGGATLDLAKLAAAWAPSLAEFEGKRRQAMIYG